MRVARAFAHQRGRERRQADLIVRIVVAARAGNEDLKRDLRQPMVFEHHQMKTVRQVGLHGLGQLDLQNVIRDRDLALLDDALCRRRVVRRRPAPRPASARPDSADASPSADAEDDAKIDQIGVHVHHGLSSVAAAGFGRVMTTLRFSGVRYCLATRCTSAAVTFASRSHRVLICPGSL